MSSQNAFPVSRGNGLSDEGKIELNRTRLIFFLNNNEKLEKFARIQLSINIRCSLRLKARKNDTLKV